MKLGLPLTKNVLTPLVKSVLLPSGLALGVSATDAAIQNEFFGSGTTIISEEEMNNIKILKSLILRFWLLVKQLKMRQKNKKADLLACR